VLPVVRNVKIVNVSGDVDSVGIMHDLADSPIRDRITAQGIRIVARAATR
jgi:hypothetical protein